MDETKNGTAWTIWTAESADALAGRDGVPEAAVAYARAVGHRFATGSHLVLPDGEGGVAGAVFTPDPEVPLAAGSLARSLPPGTWRLDGTGLDQRALRLARLGLALGGYRFDRYRTKDEPEPRPGFEAPDARTALMAEGVGHARDLVNTPASDMGPAEIEAAARELAGRHGASVEVTLGDALVEPFPMIHAVGRASVRAPRLIDMRWGSEGHPKVTLVGKGVAFDTGGLDIKSASNMLLMKKDMGGSAAVLGLASMVMAAKLPVRLRVLIPAVENAIDGNAFRPSDVLTSRKGLTVEVGNTDAEGRLVLADALALADEEEPALIVDMATLTGAARVALGPDLPPYFTRDDDLAARVEKAAEEEADPVWRLPLHAPYLKMMKSDVADTSSTGGPQAGAITAALFLARFVERAPHVHFDIYGWCPEAKPHCPKGGEAQAIRGLFAMIEGGVA